MTMFLRCFILYSGWHTKCIINVSQVKLDKKRFRHQIKNLTRYFIYALIVLIENINTTKGYRMKKTIPVSQIASIIYRTAKSSSSFNPKEEWKKAMKKAWAIVHSTKESRRIAGKKAWNKQEAKRKEFATEQSSQLKKNVETFIGRLKINRTPEQMIAEGAFYEDQKMRERGITPRVW